MIVILTLLLAAVASANTFTATSDALGVAGAGLPLIVPVPCSTTNSITASCRTSSNASSASAWAQGFIPSNFFLGQVSLPFAQINVRSGCPGPAFICGAASAAASFSVDLTVVGPTGDFGLLEVDARITTDFGTGSFSVGLPVFDRHGTHLGTRYEFVYGQPFTIIGEVHSACSECPSSGSGILPSDFVEMNTPFYISDLSGKLFSALQAPNADGQLLSGVPVPEPATSMLCGLGILVISRLAAQRRARAR